jgi:hypothetical protein
VRIPIIVKINDGTFKSVERLEIAPIVHSDIILGLWLSATNPNIDYARRMIFQRTDHELQSGYTFRPFPAAKNMTEPSHGICIATGEDVNFENSSRVANLEKAPTTISSDGPDVRLSPFPQVLGLPSNS